MAGYYLFVFAVIWCCGGFAILDSSFRDLKKIKKGHLLSSMASFIFKFAFALYFLGMHWMMAGHDYFINNERISAGGLEMQQGAFAIVYGLILFIFIKLKIINKVLLKLHKLLLKNKNYKKFVNKRSKELEQVLLKKENEPIVSTYNNSSGFGHALQSIFNFVIGGIFLVAIVLVGLFLVIKLIKFIWYL